MTYDQFVEESVTQQLAYVREERERMRKLDKAYIVYAAAAGKLGLHPLTPAEISERFHQLNGMEATVHDSHGDTPTMRSIYEARIGSVVLKRKTRR